jgi:hypothetical protein
MRAGTKSPVSTTGEDKEATAVHAWRVLQLTELGLDRPVADEIADKVDWHEVARLVRQGCPPSLAVAIVA